MGATVLRTGGQIEEYLYDYLKIPSLGIAIEYMPVVHQCAQEIGGIDLNLNPY